MKAPIRIQDNVFLVDADHELICRTESATTAELQALVNAYNSHSKLRAMLHELLEVCELNMDDLEPETISTIYKAQDLLVSY